MVRGRLLVQFKGNIGYFRPKIIHDGVEGANSMTLDFNLWFIQQIDDAS
jgi:hypothetical protein